MTNYSVPLKLKENSFIVIEGRVPKDRLNIMLSGDKGVFFVLDISFTSNKMIFIPAMPDEDPKDFLPDHYFTEPNYEIELHMFETRIRIVIGASTIHSVELDEGWLDDFKNMCITGHVKQISFKI